METATLVYDDDCGFCSWVAAFVAERSEMGIVGFSALTDEERERLPEDYEECVHLLTDDAVYSGGAAAQGVLVRMSVLFVAVFWLLEKVPGYDRLRERLYRWSADHRDWWGKVVSRDAL